YRPDVADLPDFGGLDIALVGVPMDLGVSNRAGARFGPRAVRDVERIGPYNHALRVVPRAEGTAADIRDVPMRSRFSLDSCIEDIEAFYSRIRGAGVRPLSVGGDHSIAYPILKAIGADRPLGLVHIDAHCDTMGEIDGSKFHHGGPFRQAVLAGVLDPERTIQIGIRGPAEIFWGFSYESGMTVLHIEDVDRMGIDHVVEKARAVVGDGPTYISFDVDGLDPAFAPGTGTPEPGGLTPREAQAILHGLRGLDIIGGDVVEVAPQYDPTSNTAMVGAQMLFEIFSLTVLSPSLSRRPAVSAQTRQRSVRRPARRSRISSSSASLRGGGGSAADAGSWRIWRRVSALISQNTAKLTIRNWITALRKTPIFKVTAPAFCASASVASDGPFSVTNMLVKSMPPTSRPMSGVKMSFTRLFTTAVKATPIMIPTAKSTTLPRMMKALNSSTQPGRRAPIGTAVLSLIDYPSPRKPYGLCR